MESCSFQSQLLSVMEVLAKAAVAEINRRVDDSCAVLRLEVSQSRRDIDLLKGKCEVMEAELRRSRARARRKVFYPLADEKCSPLGKVVLSRERPVADWDRQVVAENRPQQCVDAEPVNEAEHIQVKVESTEEDVWRNDAEDKPICGAEQPPCFKPSRPARAQADGFVERYHPAETPTDAGSLVSPEPQPGANQNGTELIVKHEKEEEPDENAAPLGPGRELEAEQGEDGRWDAAHPSFSHQFGQMPAVFSPQGGLHLGDAVARMHPVGRSLSVSAARAKRRARTLGCKRPQGAEGHAKEGHAAPSRVSPADQSSAPPQPQHQCRDFAAPAGNPGVDLIVPNPAASSLCGRGFALARRMRTPWRSGVGERRFSCTYCDKSFVRFSQLKEHLRSHTGEKPFSCLQCGRSFTKQCNLIRHAVVHSGEKPYQCSLCGKCFTQRSSLKSHQKTAH